MDTVTISLRKYHQLLDYEKFINEQDKVFIKDLSETEVVLISKTDAFKILEKTNQELIKEIETLSGKVSFQKDNEVILENEITELKSTIKRYKNASFWG